MIIETILKIFSQLWTLLVGAFESVQPIIGTVIAIVLGRYLWHWRSKPVLVFKGVSTTTAYDYDSEEWDHGPTVHQIHLENWGLTAAENCKPHLRLKGNSDSYEYEISKPVCWSEGDNPARQTINRGENIAFDLFREGHVDGSDYLRFPSEEGWPEYTVLIEDALPKYREQADGMVADTERNRTSTELLTGVDWDEASVEVTAENADAVMAEIEFEWDGDELASIQALQTHGSFLHYWRFVTNTIKEKLPHMSAFRFFR